MCIRTLTPSPRLDQEDPVGMVEVGIGGAPGGGNLRGGTVPVGSVGPGGERVVAVVARAVVVTVLAGMRTVVVEDDGRTGTVVVTTGAAGGLGASPATMPSRWNPAAPPPWS
jgi:hypothetical protein